MPRSFCQTLVTTRCQKWELASRRFWRCGGRITSKVDPERRNNAECVQGYLAHKKTPTHLGPHKHPGHRPAEEYWGVAFSYGRGTPVARNHLAKHCGLNFSRLRWHGHRTTGHAKHVSTTSSQSVVSACSHTTGVPRPYANANPPSPSLGP